MIKCWEFYPPTEDSHEPSTTFGAHRKIEGRAPRNDLDQWILPVSIRDRQRRNRIFARVLEILEGILAARIHIDDCPSDNGALQVIPGSHAHGRLADDEIRKWKNSGKSLVCPAKKGDILFMRPLLLHCSSKSRQPRHRRVLHIEYTAKELPFGLKWGV